MTGVECIKFVLKIVQYKHYVQVPQSAWFPCGFSPAVGILQTAFKKRLYKGIHSVVAL